MDVWTKSCWEIINCANHILRVCQRRVAGSLIFLFEVCRRLKHLMATLAHQISLSIPKTQHYITQAVESHPSVFSGSLEIQLQTLIVNPLLRVYSTLGNKPLRQPYRLYFYINTGIIPTIHDQCIWDKPHQPKNSVNQGVSRGAGAR